MALRTRVNISAMGSLVITFLSLRCRRYQLAFVTPGTSPFKASWRKHRRQMPYLRKKPRGRPQRQQRLRWRHANLGFFRSLAILAVVAMSFLSSLLPERHAHGLQQAQAFGVGARGGGDGN